MRNYRNSPELTPESDKYVVHAYSEQLYKNPNAYNFSSLALIGRRLNRQFVSLGCGSGEIEVELAKMNQDALVLGIELNQRPKNIAAANALNARIPNIRFIHGKISEVVNVMHNETADKVIIAFPPPIIKVSDQKLDILSNGNIREILCITKPGGRVTLRTDDERYFDTKVNSLLREHGVSQVTPEELPRSRFQAVWERKGKTIRTATFSKK